MRVLVPLLCLVSAACSSPPPVHHASRAGEVPANSSSETRLNGGSTSALPKEAPEAQDPTQPYMQPVDSEKTTKTGKVTRGECNELIDKYLTMQMESDPRFAGITPEMLESAKSQAQKQKGDPCKDNIPRAKYNCAIVSKSTKEWEKCMK